MEYEEGCYVCSRCADEGSCVAAEERGEAVVEFLESCAKAG